MAEFDDLERTLTQELNRVGDAARPPTDAWERFGRRFGSHSRTPSGEINVMSIEPSADSPGPNRRRWLLLVAAAASVALVAAGLVVVVRDDSTDVVPVDTTPATVPGTAAPAPTTTTPTETSLDTATAPAPTTEPDPTSQPSPVTVPTPTAALEESSADAPLVQSGETTASPVGDITWTRVDGDATNLPQSVDFEDAGRFYGSDDAATSWRSDDGIAWTRIAPLPGRPGGYVEVGDVVWTTIDPFRSDEPPQLGRWDGTAFVPVELPPLDEPEVTGLRPTARSLSLTPFRGELAVVASTPSQQQILIGGDSGFDTLAPPQPDASILGLADVDGRLLALVDHSTPRPSQSGTRFSLWASDDTMRWTEVELPEPAGSSILDIDLVGDGQSAVVNIASWGQVEAWFTDDGTTWQPTDTATDVDTISAADFGWVMDRSFALDRIPPGYLVAVSADGITWQDILVALDFPDGGFGISVDVAGNAIFLSQYEDSGDRTIWIGVVNSR